MDTILRSQLEARLRAAIEKRDTQKEQLAQLKAINAAIRALDE